MKYMLAYSGVDLGQSHPAGSRRRALVMESQLTKPPESKIAFYLYSVQSKIKFAPYVCFLHSVILNLFPLY